MTPNDCFQMGKQLYLNDNNYERAILWILRAIDIYFRQEQSEKFSFSYLDALDLLVNIYFHQGNLKAYV